MKGEMVPLSAKGRLACGMCGAVLAACFTYAMCSQWS